MMSYYIGMMGWQISSYLKSGLNNKFGGKELDRMFGLDCQDFGARWYQPSLGLWHTPDVYCEDTPWLSPYIQGDTNQFIYRRWLRVHTTL